MEIPSKIPNMYRYLYSWKTLTFSQSHSCFLSFDIDSAVFVLVWNFLKVYRLFRLILVFPIYTKLKSLHLNLYTSTQSLHYINFVFYIVYISTDFPYKFHYHLYVVKTIIFF